MQVSNYQLINLKLIQLVMVYHLVLIPEQQLEIR